MLVEKAISDRFYELGFFTGLVMMGCSRIPVDIFKVEVADETPPM